MSFLDRVQACNARDPARFRPFVLGGRQLGWLTPERAETLLGFTDVFTLWQRANTPDGVTFAGALAHPAAASDRSQAVAALLSRLVDSGRFGKARRELYAVRNRWSDPEAFRIDRGLVAGFGFRAYGVHLNGYVRRGRDLFLWVGTRALDCAVEPGKFDNMVAGGQPAHLSLRDNLIKEAGEEAGLAPDLAGRAVPVGTVCYAFEAPEGLKADTLFCYDLELPPDVTPQSSEEISRFELMALADVLDLVRTGTRFKFNVTLVILDFAIRHGVLSADEEPDFEAIAQGLREVPQPIV